MSQTHIKILKLAKLYINREEEQFVCIAIKLAAERLYAVRFCGNSKIYRDLHKETSALLELIEKSLEGNETVNGWLCKVYGIIGIDMKQYRMVWIDNMIEYWKGKP